MAYIVLCGCSDDGFEYFRCWLIAQGKDVFENALQDPDSLLPVFDRLRKKEVMPELEELLYVCTDAYTQKLQLSEDEGMEKYSDLEQQLYPNTDLLPKIEFNWSDEDPASMRRICPNVYKKCESRVENDQIQSSSYFSPAMQP